MKAFIFFFTIVLLAPVIHLRAQANSNYTYHGSYPQYYFVRTVSGRGIIPTTSKQVIDKDGTSISCSSRDLNSQNKSRQHCTTDSLINSLDTCATCKIVKTKEQMDVMYKQLAMITSVNLVKKCPSGYGQATYALYQRNNDRDVPLWIKISKGCGITDGDNKLINNFIREFEKQGDYSLLNTQNNTLAAKQSEPVSDSIDKNFVPELNEFFMPGLLPGLPPTGKLLPHSQKMIPPANMFQNACFAAVPCSRLKDKNKKTKPKTTTFP